jgi:glycosyltransferase involved in cell wall biosynthesis
LVVPALLAANPDFARSIPTQELDAVRGRLTGGAPYLLCTAFSHPHKNLHTLARAYGRIQRQVPHALVLVGQARRGEPLLQEALREVPDHSRVRRIKRLTLDELIPAFQAADLFVFPSKYEGFGLPALEAQMAGIPLVTTPCASLPEVTGGLATVCDPDNPDSLATGILEVLNWTLETRRDHVEKARRHARLFTWAATAETTLSTLRGVMRT